MNFSQDRRHGDLCIFGCKSCEEASRIDFTIGAQFGQIFAMLVDDSACFMISEDFRLGPVNKP